MLSAITLDHRDLGMTTQHCQALSSSDLNGFIRFRVFRPEKLFILTTTSKIDSPDMFLKPRGIDPCILSSMSTSSMQRSSGSFVDFTILLGLLGMAAESQSGEFTR
jgi:hypothetical protein